MTERAEFKYRCRVVSSRGIVVMCSLGVLAFAGVPGRRAIRLLDPLPKCRKSPPATFLVFCHFYALHCTFCVPRILWSRWKDLFNILACDWCFEIFNILFKILVVVHRGTAMVTIRRVISFWDQRARSSEAVR